MTSAIADARATLAGAIAAAVPAPWSGRVHRTAPAQVVAPAIFLDSAELSTSSEAGAAVVEVTFPVVVVMDGKVEAQVAALDDALAAVWTAAIAAGGDPTGSRPLALDVGGPTLRAHALRVDMLLAALSLCPPSLVTAGGP